MCVDKRQTKRSPCKYVGTEKVVTDDFFDNIVDAPSIRQAVMGESESWAHYLGIRGGA